MRSKTQGEARPGAELDAKREEDAMRFTITRLVWPHMPRQFGHRARRLAVVASTCFVLMAAGAITAYAAPSVYGPIRGPMPPFMSTRIS